MYYTGRLANGKIFDSTTTGNGFKFKLGKKEVISGWDVGLAGMLLLYLRITVKPLMFACHLLAVFVILLKSPNLRAQISNFKHL